MPNGDADDDDDADDDAIIFFNQLGQPPLQCCIGGSHYSADVDPHQLGPGEEGYLPSSILPGNIYWCPDTC